MCVRRELFAVVIIVCRRNAENVHDVGPLVESVERRIVCSGSVAILARFTCAPPATSASFTTGAGSDPFRRMFRAS